MYDTRISDADYRALLGGLGHEDGLKATRREMWDRTKRFLSEPYIFPIDPPRRCRSITFDSTIFPIVHQEEIPMKATPIQKLRIAANNAGAMFRAKEAQHLRLIERLQAEKAAVEAESHRLSGALTARTNELHSMAKLAETHATDIAAFKLEALQLTTENAALRGYVGRVLEDDTVREVGGEKAAEAVLDECERRHFQEGLQRDAMARRQPPRSVRTGPFPSVYMGADQASNGIWQDTKWDGYSGDKKVEPRHWLNR